MIDLISEWLEWYDGKITSKRFCSLFGEEFKNLIEERKTKAYSLKEKILREMVVEKPEKKGG